MRTILIPLLLLSAVPAAAQVAADTTATVVPRARYQSHGFRRFFLGGTYRDQWATPITAPVLDLARHAGGMTATERGGSRQSRSLRFAAGDGRVLVFRALEKDPTQTWPAPLRASVARRVAEDQISAILPTGALAVAELERAAGLINPGVDLVILPDDPRLGEWRAEFAGTLGILEQRLRGSGAAIRDVPGAVEVATSDRLFNRLLDDGRHVVDQRAYLAARLFDLVVGDWDRHGGQWGWARFDEGDARVWRPIPRDRDWALSRLDGPLYGLLRLYLPKYQTLDRRYGSVYGLTLSAEALDRRLLAGLDRAVWDSATAALQSRLTDSVIAGAVGRLPATFGDEFKAELAAILASRRDQLPGAAASFYRLLSDIVEFRGSDQADRADITALDDGDVAVRLTTGRAGTVRFSRVFDPRVTREVRIYLGGGADSVRWDGPSSGRIRIRVIDPEGPAVSGDAAAMSVHDSTSAGSDGPFEPGVIRRDWGKLMGVAPWLEARPEIGLLAGGGPVFYRYGFRRYPYASRMAVRASYATATPGINLDFKGDFRSMDPRRRVEIDARFLRVDVARYFGAGNETTRAEPDSFYTVRQRLVDVTAELHWTPSPGVTLGAGPFFRWSDTDLDESTQLSLDRPYGAGRFGEAGLSVSAAFDSRDHPVYPTRGVTARASVAAAPPVFDVERTYALASVNAAAYLTAAGIPASPTLALRAGASRSFGDAPFFDAPTLGGRRSIRGLNSHRYLGNAAVNAGAELRLALGGFALLLPGEWGVFGLGDVGRVYLDGERSDEWHGAAGGGLWFAFLDRMSTVTITWARSEERNRLYIQAGFHY